MIKYTLTLLLLLAATAVIAQKKSVINLISSESIQGVKINGVDVLKVYKGVFQQDYSTLRSDSAYFHQKENTFEAFSHVVITQGDTLNIYSDKLNYNGNTKIAILTDNVKMVDKDAILTTNYLTYNTATRFGTYTGGGKLVNKDNTLTSKNGYYFANSRDSYFRYDVNLVTPDALILTDTMRYNTGSRIAYFYGPTNIYGKKDKDTLYTENGTYNTITEQAFFGKKNLYKQGTKSLKGDSLFYDRKKGYGRAVKNITFNDNEQKMTLKGDLGTYYKADERTVVTENAYGIIVTEEKDTTKNDSIATVPVSLPEKAQKIKADTAKAPSMKAPPTDSKLKKAPDAEVKDLQPKKVTPKMPPETKRSATVKKADKAKKAAGKHMLSDTAGIKKDSVKMKHDSIYMTADTLETQIMTYKNLKALQEKRRLSGIIDTSVKAPSIVYKKPIKHIELAPPQWVPDTAYFHTGFFGTPKPKNAPPLQKTDTPAVKKMSKQDSLKKIKSDSVYMTRKIELSDTSRIRILSGYHHAKMFKSDLQAKSDSIFYSNSDSTIRLYVKPIIWTQGSQLTGDTINLQLKNKKLDNMELYPNAFVVNVEKGDSVHFNQISGKKMRGFFKDGKLQRMFIDGNAESIYFSRDSGKVSGMQRSLSSRIRVNFKDSKVSNLTFLSKPEHRYGPLDKFTEDDKVLKGFIWKPKERPVSKESIIASFNKIEAVKPSRGKLPDTSKTSSKKLPNVKGGKDTSRVKSGKLTMPVIKPVKDTTLKAPADKLPDVKAGTDTGSVNQPKPVKPATDSTIQSVPQQSPDVRTRKDTVEDNPVKHRE